MAVVLQSLQQKSTVFSSENCQQIADLPVKLFNFVIRLSLLDFALDATTFTVLDFFGFFESEKAENPVDNQAKVYPKARFQGHSRRLLREPLPRAKKRKAPP